MEREQARQEVRSRISCTEYLTKSKSGMYCCPKCGSGTGKNATGAVKYYTDTNTWYCHACQQGGDVIDLYQMKTGADYNTALSLLAESIGITIDQYRPGTTQEAVKRHETTASSINTPPADKAPENGTETPTEADYTAYYQECRQRITDPAAAAYLRSRGISPETAAAYWIGYDPAADPAQSNHPCPRLIIPTSRAHYIGRRIDGIKEYAKMTPKGSTPAIFNSKALYAQGVQEVFIVEGAIDALSLLEAGYTAIALNSAGYFNTLLRLLEDQRTDATLILCPDSDENPKTAATVKKNFDALAAGLQRLNISYIFADINGKYKDANEHLTNNKDTFLEAVREAQWKIRKPDNTAYYIDTLMTGEIERFKDDKKTGFSNLDANAGGLYSGLYALAAISSLGKTSFALQLADQLAEAGHEVIYFSLEQSRLEMVSKSIARRTAQKNIDKAITSLAIRKGYRSLQVMEAIQEYKEAVADRISVIEGNFNCNVSYIGNYIRQYIQRNNARPVVFIDYLQILQPAEDRRQSTKEAIDTIITDLKRISRELDITIFIISSVNRANYLTPIDFESLKESGGIEFTCDVVWGLQLQCLNEDLFTKGEQIQKKRERIKQAKAENPRKIELVCLKNRYGIANYSCFFKYYPANDLFTEDRAAFENTVNKSPWDKAARY